MKKVISVIILIALLSVFVGSFTVDSYEESEVHITAVFEGPVSGRKAAVGLYIDNNPGFMYLCIKPTFDNAVFTFKGIDTSDAEIEFDTEVGETVNNIIFDSNGDVSATGKIATVLFEVAPDAAPGTYEIGFTVKGCYNLDEATVPASVEKASVEIKDMSIKLSSETAPMGSSVTLSLTAENNRGFAYAVITPQFNKDVLTLVNVKSSVIDTCELGTNILLTNRNNVTADGVIATLEFEIAADAPEGDYEVTLVLRELYDINEAAVRSGIEGGVITVNCDHLHTETRNALPATCTEPGYTGDVYCTDCGQLIEQGTEIPAKGHSFGEPVFEWAEDLTSAEAVFTCTECGQIERISATVTDDPNVVTENGLVCMANEYTAAVEFEGAGYTEVKSVIMFIYGDANEDGAIDGKDLIRLRKYLDNLDTVTGVSTFTVGGGADATGDGVTDGKDLIRLRKYLDNYDDATHSSTIALGPSGN